MKYLVTLIILLSGFSSAANTIGGIGIILKKENGKTLVQRVLDGSPAKANDIAANDEIKEIYVPEHRAWQSVERMPLESVVELIRGPKMTQLGLRVRTPPENSTREIWVKRTNIRFKHKV